MSYDEYVEGLASTVWVGGVEKFTKAHFPSQGVGQQLFQGPPPAFKIFEEPRNLKPQNLDQVNLDSRAPGTYQKKFKIFLKRKHRFTNNFFPIPSPTPNKQETRHHE